MRVVECSHLRVIGGAQFPAAHAYSADFIGLIEWMLTLDRTQRPFVPQVLEHVNGLLQRS